MAVDADQAQAACELLHAELGSGEARTATKITLRTLDPSLIAFPGVSHVWLGGWGRSISGGRGAGAE